MSIQRLIMVSQQKTRSGIPIKGCKCWVWQHVVPCGSRYSCLVCTFSVLLCLSAVGGAAFLLPSVKKYLTMSVLLTTVYTNYILGVIETILRVFLGKKSVFSSCSHWSDIAIQSPWYGTRWRGFWFCFPDVSTKHHWQRTFLSLAAASASAIGSTNSF